LYFSPTFFDESLWSGKIMLIFGENYFSKAVKLFFFWTLFPKYSFQKLPFLDFLAETFSILSSIFIFLVFLLLSLFYKNLSNIFSATIFFLRQ